MIHLVFISCIERQTATAFGSFYKIFSHYLDLDKKRRRAIEWKEGDRNRKDHHLTVIQTIFFTVSCLNKPNSLLKEKLNRFTTKRLGIPALLTSLVFFKINQEPSLRKDTVLIAHLLPANCNSQLNWLTRIKTLNKPHLVLNFLGLKCCRIERDD